MAVPAISATKTRKYVNRFPMMWPVDDMSVSPADEIEEREQEDPHQIDEVPVKAHDLDRRVPLRGELPLGGHAGDDRHDHHADDHVGGVQTGQGEIERV